MKKILTGILILAGLGVWLVFFPPTFGTKTAPADPAAPHTPAASTAPATHATSEASASAKPTAAATSAPATPAPATPAPATTEVSAAETAVAETVTGTETAGTDTEPETAAAEPDGTESITLGSWTPESLTELAQTARKRNSVPEHIRYLSEQFLDTPYEANTLIGDAETPEQLTVNLAGLDCFTYIDYVEALRLSDSFPAFKETLQSVRYRDGTVRFTNRNHFFSDWTVHNGDRITDVTRQIGGDAAVSAEKTLNVKKDGTHFLPGIPAVTRTVTHIPTGALDDAVIAKLRTGDYIGVYTDIDGLDVTHTGIIIKKEGGTYLRHASSRRSVGNRVIDDELLTYLDGKPGIVVYRPRDRAARRM